MADAKKETPAIPDQPVVAVAGGGAPKLYIVLGLAAIVLLELIIGYFVIVPSAKETAGALKQNIDSDPAIPSNIDPAPDEAALAPAEPQFEIPVDFAFKYSVSGTGAVGQSTVYTMKFTLLANKKEEEELKKEYEGAKNQIQAAILLIVRTSESKDVINITSTVITNKIRIKANEILGKPVINKVICTDHNWETT